MAWLNISLLAALSVLAVVSAANRAQLEFHPGGDHRVGDTIKVVCRAVREADDFLDTLKIVKKIDDKNYEISTNDYMSTTFMDTGRYSMAWIDNDNMKEASATIKEAQGSDGGYIGCIHSLIEGDTDEAFEDFVINVPITSISLKHYRNGEEHIIDDELIVIREGEDSGIECEVFIDGSNNIANTTTITMNGEDSTALFSKEADEKMDPNGGLVQKSVRVTYTYLFREPDLKLHGQQLTCTSKANLYDAVSATAMLHIHYKPRLDCQHSGADIGERAMVTCTGHMFPALDLVSVNWKRKANEDTPQQTFTLTQTEPQSDGHFLNVTVQEDGSYVFDMIIEEVKEGDFGSYKFEVQNSHDIAESKVKLQKGAVGAAGQTTFAQALLLLPLLSYLISFHFRS